MSAHDPELHQLRLAAAAKVPTAWFTLGAALVARQQMEEAYGWHLRAAQAGLANAQIEAARMLMYGVGTDTDVAAAIGWLLRAEQAGSPIAGYFLALIALGGTAMPNDSRINERLFAAMQADYPPALRAAAIHFGRKPGDTDQVAALQLFERDHPEAGNRARTICVYLNDVEAGGETEFPVAGVRVKPQAGRAVIFDNLREDGSPDVDSLHAGMPVVRGEKWLATLWIRQGGYRAF